MKAYKLLDPSKIQTGIVSLRSLYEFVNEHPAPETITNRSDCVNHRKFSALIKDLITDQVPEIQGIYEWGSYDSQGRWSSIYVGQASPVKRGLRGRISEELRDWRCLFHAHVATKEAIFAIGANHYPGTFDAVYERQWELHLLKKKVTHIVWAADLSADSRMINLLEDQLIQKARSWTNVDRSNAIMGCLEQGYIIAHATEMFNRIRKTVAESSHLSYSHGEVLQCMITEPKTEPSPSTIKGIRGLVNVGPAANPIKLNSKLFVPLLTPPVKKKQSSAVQGNIPTSLEVLMEKFKHL